MFTSKLTFLYYSTEQCNYWSVIIKDLCQNLSMEESGLSLKKKNADLISECSLFFFLSKFETVLNFDISSFFFLQNIVRMIVSVNMGHHYLMNFFV